MKNIFLFCLVQILLITPACKKDKLNSQPSKPDSTSTASIQVDCGDVYGTFDNSLYRRANITFTGGNVGSNPLKAIDNDYLIEKGIAQKAARLFISVNTINDLGISNYDNYVADAKRVPEKLLVNVSGSVTGSITDTAQYRTLVRQLLTHFKAIASNIVYIEATNEYDLFSPAISDEDYYNIYYKIIYQEVNRYNASLPEGQMPLQVGGPCISQWNSTKMQNFINNYAADTDHNKRLDFISYHEYCSWNTKGETNTDHLIQLGTRRSNIENWLTAKGLSADIPAFITEHGIFPGNKLYESGNPYTEAGGMLMAAASAATYNYYYVTTGNNKMFPFFWDTRLTDHNEKSFFADNTKYGVNVPTTFGNTILALSQMDSIRIKSTSAPIDNTTGFGVYCLATKDANSVTALVWNWQHRNSATHTVDVSFSNLPSAFSGKKVKMTRSVIDSTHSNFLYDASHANLQTVDSSADFNISKYSITLAPNVVSLIRLTPGQ
ncbi:hypothetical protein A9P82_10155 [Arachidicoccus ginsenosidimutans]|uniref:hypothetical protein n=1 Tax=Arachidicoccus sp. BS20 TaxID=1850526 RepID=UPI0007F0F660|nr:hypothetical protein [Arachidicoccus sp. BS20]ANI89618.1 hypothetical protein A9P82_10155 [Arachidicoccus sp. BS20]